MENKIKNKIKVDFTVPSVAGHSHRRFDSWQRTISIISLIALVITWTYFPLPKAHAVGIDAVTASVPEGSDGTGAAAQVTVAFESTVLSDSEAFTIYLGNDTTTGDAWGLNGVGTGDITCTDDGTGESYTVNSVNAASSTLPMRTQITATTVGSGAATTTCLIGDASPNPTNPATADGYSVAVVTSADSGAGAIYIGDANDVTVSLTVLPNLALTLDSPTSNCSGTNVITCNLGTASTAAVSTGAYDVNVGSNAASGVTLRVKDDGNLRYGSDDIDDISEATVTAGVEGYGIGVVAGSGWTEQDPFDDDDTAITNSNQTVATTAAPIDIGGQDVAVTHSAAISSTTKPMTYSHVVTWSVIANF
jgi:hypothetical protein